MGVLCDKSIRKLSTWNEDRPDNWKPMISPYDPNSVRETDNQFAGSLIKEKILSYGTSSYGYDVRLAPVFKIFVPTIHQVIDPLNMEAINPANMKTIHRNHYDLPPGGFVLGHTLETFAMPRDLVIQCLGKSTYARLGIFVNVTPIEPEFEGQVVLEIFNSLPLPVRLHANQGIAQFMFFEGDEPCETSYADRAGKYQGQTGIQMAKV